MYSYLYPRPSLTTDAILCVRSTDGWNILLIERGNDPYKGKWALPGGFMDMEETLLEACVREVAEETGLRIGDMKQFRTYDAVDRDPRGRTISVVFYAFLEECEAPEAGDDAARAKWFQIDRLPELAFDHDQIIADFILDILN